MRFKARPLEGHLQVATAVAFSSEGSRACSASADGTCRLWRTEDATCYFVLQSDGAKRVACCNFSADGKMIISGDWAYMTRVWDAVSGHLVMSLSGHQGKLTAACFRSDGNLMLTASEDKTLRTWDPRRGVSVAFAAPDEVLDGKFATDMVSILGACKNGMLLLWDIRKPDTPRLEIEAHGTDWVTCCAFSALGDTALTGSTDRSMKLWDLRGGGHLQTFQGHQEAVNGCRFLGDCVVSGAGNRFWGSKDNTIVVWQPSTGQSFRTLKGHGDAVMGIDTFVDRDKMMIASASMDKTVRIWTCDAPARKKEDPATLGIDCKFGCGIQLPADRMALHELQCPQLGTECPSCHQKMTLRELQLHAAECPENEFECACGAMIKRRDTKKHAQDECPLREVDCTLGCGMILKASGLDLHLKTSCPERLVKCPKGCGASIAARNLSSHQQKGCQVPPDKR